MQLAVVALVILVAAVALYLQWSDSYRLRLETTDTEITVVTGRLFQRTRETLRWAALREVTVRTWASGHLSFYAHVELDDAEGHRLSIPAFAITDAFLSRLRALPGFDASNFQIAMKGGQDLCVRCWSASGQAR